MATAPSLKKSSPTKNDFVGMVAYTLYKRQKVEWLEKFYAENQQPPIAALITLAASGLIWVSMQGPETLIRQSIEKAISKPAPNSGVSNKQP